VQMRLDARSVVSARRWRHIHDGPIALRMTLQCWCRVLCTAIASATPALAAAECGQRPVNACELVNDDRDIFVGRVVAARPDNPFEWRVRVVRSYRGAASGEVVVRVFTRYDLPAPGDLHVGQSYLFYTSNEQDDDGRLVRATPLVCGDWLPLASVSRDELAFLRRLGSAATDGRIFGTLSRPTVDAADPAAGVEIRATSGGKTATTTTDRDGRFEIRGLAAGTYRVSAGLPESLALQGDTSVSIVPHGCYDASLSTVPNTTIGGRVVLPLGVQVTGTQVTAFASDGRDVKSTFTDPFGRYQLSGLGPGDYLIGINAGQYQPRTAAPFPPTTFAPGTTERSQARTIHIDGPAHLTDVDVVVPKLSGIVRIAVKSTFADGSPVTEQSLRLSTTGYGEFDIHTTRSADGAASVSVVRGVQVYILGSARGGCMPPVRVGADDFPERIEAVFTPDGCREMSNLTQMGILEASWHGGFTRLRIRVTFADGRPAYNAHVGMVSAPGRGPFAQGFSTDRNGSLDIPVPSGSEFIVDAGAPDGVRGCSRPGVVVNTDSGIRWRPRDERDSSPGWNDLVPGSDPLALVLRGDGCRP
jgi:carboxypeptidase family protein